MSIIARSCWILLVALALATMGHAFHFNRPWGTSLVNRHTYGQITRQKGYRAMILLATCAFRCTVSSIQMSSQEAKPSSSAVSPRPSIVPDGGASPCVIKVIGVGGAGGNAVMRMIQTGVEGVGFAAINTDAQALAKFRDVATTVNIGRDVTRGLGAGGIPDNGRKAAEESRKEIHSLVEGCDLVFITAGMGGGTGSGAAPVVAEIAREAGALTVGVVTKPFGFEGRRRMQQALQAIENLRAVVDTLIIVSNDRLLQIIPENTPLEKAFTVADDVLRQGVVGISEIIIRPGLINVDFADVRTIMGDAGTALMGIGKGSGKGRATEAATAAISSPLLDFPIERARGVVFNVVGGEDLTLQEINAAAEVIYEAVDPNANIIFGSLVDPAMNGQVAITVIATGFPVALTEGSASAGGLSNEVTAGAAVKKAAQQVETQAQILSTQLNNRRRSAQYLQEFSNGAGEAASDAASRMKHSTGMPVTPGGAVSTDQRSGGSDRQQSTGGGYSSASAEDDDYPDFMSRLRRKK